MGKSDHPDGSGDPEKAPPPLPPGPLGAGVPPQPVPPAPQPRVEPDQVRRAIGLLCQPDQLFEVRILDAVPTSGWRKARTFAGYFHGSDSQKVIEALRAFESWRGVYLTLNPLDEALYARSADRIQDAKATAQDDHVTARHLVLLDFDVVRPSGISATEAEHEMGLKKARDVRRYLTEEQGWPEPALASSGNGGHLIYRIALSADDDIVQSVLKSLDVLFSDEGVVVDTSVHNASRISKLYGTLVCKGDSIPDRKHRMARITEAPDSLEVTPREKLEELVELAEVRKVEHALEAPDIVAAPPNPAAPEAFDVSAFVERSGLEIARVQPWKDGRKWILSRCPMDDSHEADRAAWIVQMTSGAVAAGCHHNRCSWKWRDLRDRYDPRAVAGPVPNPSAQSGLDRAALVVPGARVRAHDRENIGTVLGVAGDTATIHFVSPGGTAATKDLPIAKLTVIAGAGSEGLAQPREYVFLGLDEILEGEWPEFLVDGLLDRRELAVLYGEPASFKSFLALDLSLCVAIGIPWHVHSTKESRVLYVAGEGQIGLRMRVSAWVHYMRACMSQDDSLNPEHLDEALRERFFAIGSAVPLVEPVEPDNLLVQLRAQLDRLGGDPALIVLDTLARCFLGGDENSSRDMGRFVDACDRIRKETDAAVLVIHHTGKDGDLERGSSALRAGADTMIKVSREEQCGESEGAARLAVEKRKDGAHSGDLVFDMRLVDLGSRPDGRALSSLVPVPSDSTVAGLVPEGGGNRGYWRRGGRKGKEKLQLIALLASLSTTFERKGASATKLIADADVPRSTAYKRLRQLELKGHVEVDESGRTEVYTISAAGREWLSSQSPKSQSLQVSQTSGQSLVSRESPPPLMGGGDDTETETDRRGVVGADRSGGTTSTDAGSDADVAGGEDDG